MPKSTRFKTAIVIFIFYVSAIPPIHAGLNPVNYKAHGLVLRRFDPGQTSKVSKDRLFEDLKIIQPYVESILTYFWNI